MAHCSFCGPIRSACSPLDCFSMIGPICGFLKRFCQPTFPRVCPSSRSKAFPFKLIRVVPRGGRPTDPILSATVVFKNARHCLDCPTILWINPLVSVLPMPMCPMIGPLRSDSSTRGPIWSQELRKIRPLRRLGIVRLRTVRSMSRQSMIRPLVRIASFVATIL